MKINTQKKTQSFTYLRCIIEVNRQIDEKYFDHDIFREKKRKSYRNEVEILETVTTPILTGHYA